MNIVWLSVNEETPARGYWDQHLLERLFKNDTHFSSISKDLKDAVVVIPGAYQGKFIDTINEQLSLLESCLVIITSDEGNNFPMHLLKHSNMILWANYPTKKYDSIVDTWLPIGPARTWKQKEDISKIYNWSFSGQVTNEFRNEYVKKLSLREDGKLIQTKGFAQGLDHESYHKLLAESKVAPAPSGPFARDSFRLYEAIEQGAVPIPQDPPYWDMIFDNPPFPIISIYHQLDGYINDVLVNYIEKNNQVQSWWLIYQRDLRKKLVFQMELLSGNSYANDLLTVVIPASPIKSHPDIKVLQETISTIRTHLPDQEIIITFDGVRSEQSSMKDQYNEHIRRVLWKCYNEWENVTPVIFNEHMHQVGMMRYVLETMISTPLLMYVEHDTPITPDMEIDFSGIQNELLNGTSNMIRLHFESVIPKEHMHMIHGMDSRSDVPLMMTSQWSQRPHITSTAFYKRILSNHFSPDAKSFIEDKMHGVVDNAFREDGMLGWEQFKVHIYHPEGNIKRSYHIDGREGEAKYDGTQVF